MTKRLVIVAALVAAALAVPVLAAGGRDAVLAEYSAQAKAADGKFKGFAADRGKTLYMSQNSGGNPDTPSCSACHTASPLNSGKTRAGKSIDPMAVSASPQRFTDIGKTEKWFGRNCKSVLGRECTAQEKGDFITYLSSL
jgi:mono/diheme cytochrome c family protein